MSDLAPGLYLVATPIGAARDITLRALDVLRDADMLAAEDTRVLRHLMEIHGIPIDGRTVISYHDHNGERARPGILAALAAGKSVAYASDAGTPLVADPGYALAREARAAGHLVTTAPGPSAALAALSLSGLPTDRFLFAGFLPAASGARTRTLDELGRTPATLVFFETARRCSVTIREILARLGDREAALCRELTKRFEEVRQGRLSELLEGIERDPPRGEIVLVIDRDRREAGADDIEAALLEALETMSVKDAAKVVSESVGAPRRDVYQMALRLGRGS
ncbi:16S rRNA (cytidine1402-2'-O)-methyltransferase [Palleronia marisminoris]|uniref:Ribosomal RNA small subunit methyltransferase I n=1 Tax=Palleronia marisminoris TaxID=315423 RepID=A0A1Y5RYG0_9RHOB|nr:16S rRNA (cytidine(1402)-2'-O)-methyltransferase [Palleronia marisminoris]SFG47469.1 16S rRNA (cytidine1402-2'-O)-methyltransferase [Palleronia marisminoris]SLN25472.1 Ribosomal RNA small subunit methyltransferase I [Palleronia marisminoris]